MITGRASPGVRNRYADFLRAASIGAVVVGHWLMTSPWYAAGEVHVSLMLEHGRWTHWLSWAFQVMPVFFLVGGYANGASWHSALRTGKTYQAWLQVRLQRLVGPVLPLLVAWTLFVAVANRLGAEPGLLQLISRISLIPLWFLAVYLMVVTLVPVTYEAWTRYGTWSWWVPVLAAGVNDVLGLALGIHALEWLNYAFVWLAVHQLGYAWRDGLFRFPRRSLAWAAGAFAVLIALVALGPYPLSMVGVPGQEVSNTQPPKLTILALGAAQCGLFLSLEQPMQRWLLRARPWRLTMRVNGIIMTIFLWHLTASTFAIGLAAWFGGIGLTPDPGSPEWWAVRPAWLLAYAFVLSLLVFLFGRFERAGSADRPPTGWRLIPGVAFVCMGLTMLADEGMLGDGWLGLRIPAVALALGGAILTGVNPLRK